MLALENSIRSGIISGKTFYNITGQFAVAILCYAAAAHLGANAVVAIDIDYEVLGETNGMLMVTVSGTAVVID